MIMDDKAVDEARRMDWLVSRQLKYGIWFASSVTALGTIVAIFGRWIVPHAHTMTLGTSIVRKGIRAHHSAADPACCLDADHVLARA